MNDGSKDGKEFTDSLVHLLTVGFYLINVGAISVALKYGDPINDLTGAVELLSTKVGIILLVLGLVHSVILAKLTVIRRNVVQGDGVWLDESVTGKASDTGPVQ